MNLTEMRAHVVGPCDEAEKAELRTLFIDMGENVESGSTWKWGACPVVRYQNDEWITASDRFTPTISFPDFKAKYLTK